jgi:serine/threonine protein kinase/dipeptidyl aminopeptidase/acylaminoacyl peptidase
MIGRVVAHYQILDTIGEGGMGVVYKARDTQLDRIVALKVLPPDKVADPERKRRFVQEARAASALNHPHIVTIHDIVSDSGVAFIVMEFIAGTTLGQLIGRKGLTLREVLKYGAQIADALTAAHAAGIIHRDLKPGNVMVTDNGLVKVLDFGLAKLAEAPATELAPTETLKPQTMEGTIVGTVAYMSPEQAQGKRIDARSDIFSFGSVLYEMIAGRRAFHGETALSTLSAILEKEPAPISTIAGNTPPELEKLVARCIRKDPERRIQHMDDVRGMLQDLKEESDSGLLLRKSESPRWRISAPVIVAGAVLIAAMAAASWWLSRPKPAQSIAVLNRLTSDSGLTWEPALSADGKLIAYSSDRGAPPGQERNLDIWVQQLAGGEPIRLTHDPADDRQPAFSPDGSRIAFRSDREGGGIYVVPALGGEERLIAPNGQRPRFSPDGQWILYWVGNEYTGDPAAAGSARAYVVPSTGGAPRRIHPEFTVIREPLWSPDGKRLIFWGKRDANVTGPEASEWWVAPLDGGAAVATGAAAALRSQGLSGFIVPSVWLTDGRLLFAAAHGDSSDLWQLSLERGTWRAAGTPARITAGTGTSGQPSVAVVRDAAGGSVALLAFSALSRDVQIWGVPFDANHGKMTGELRRLTQGPAAARFGALSEDGKRLVFARSRAGDSDIWIKDLQTGRETDLTPTPADQFHPRIAADGSKVSYSETNAGVYSLYTMTLGSAADGSIRPGVPKKLCDGCRYSWQWTWDGTRVLFDSGLGAAGRPYIKVADVSSGETNTLISHAQYNLYQSNSSPDGRWVAFLAHIDTLHARLFIVPFRPGPEASEEVPGDWTPVTGGQARDDKPRWSPDGNSLYFISDRDGFLCFWAQQLDAATKRPVGPPLAIYHLHSASRSIMNVGLAALEPALARDLMAFNVAETTGNVWTATIEPPK